jgi:fatty-acyl-CoA synthase
MAAVELRDGATFDPATFAAFLDGQEDLGTKWAPRFVRVAQSLPLTATNKVDKAPLRRQAWRVDDTVWWRPPREAAYRLLTPEVCAELEQEFERHGRTNVLPV